MPVFNDIACFSYERISQISGQFGVLYDRNGNMVARHNYTFQYDVFGRLQKVVNYGKCISTMIYHDFGDQVGSPLQKTKLFMQIRYNSEEKEIIQYYYGNREKPFLITAIFSTHNGWAKFYHDDKDRLFAMLHQPENQGATTNKQLCYIITDISGTPTHILNSTGKYVFIC
jgi:hypothetical protein